MNKDIENKLVPRLRFSEFETDGLWRLEKVEKLINALTPPKKLQSSQYLKEGKFPIIDQSKSEICGWTYDVESVISLELPLIIFGDHTCILKFVNYSFSQGADGVKILKPNNKIQTTFLYQALINNPVIQEEYKRHFSILKEKLIAFPDVDSGEQQKISDCLSSLDDLIKAETEKLDALKDHKKGLMQQLFPADGEKVPKLRFPEFKDSGEWEEDVLENVATFLKGKGISKADISPNGSLPCIRYGELYTHYSEIIEEVISFTDVEREELVLSEAHDVIIPSSGETQIDIATASCVISGGIALGGDLNIIRSDINGTFMAYYLSHNKKHAIAKMAQGNAVVHLYNNQLKKLKINFPSSKDEQQKIADCLSSLDKQFGVQTQKIENLKLHKKGLMQGLFPKIN